MSLPLVRVCPLRLTSSSVPDHNRLDLSPGEKGRMSVSGETGPDLYVVRIPCGSFHYQTGSNTESLSDPTSKSLTRVSESYRN